MNERKILKGSLLCSWYATLNSQGLKNHDILIWHAQTAYAGITVAMLFRFYTKFMCIHYIKTKNTKYKQNLLLQNTVKYILYYTALYWTEP